MHKKKQGEILFVLKFQIFSDKYGKSYSSLTYLELHFCSL